MAEKEEIDTNDSNASEVSSLEKLDSNDQTEIIPAEEVTVEPLIILQDEVVSEETQNESGEPDSDAFNEEDVPPIPDDGSCRKKPRPKIQRIQSLSRKTASQTRMNWMTMIL